jgi:hypothetical protein
LITFKNLIFDGDYFEDTDDFPGDNIEFIAGIIFILDRGFVSPDAILLLSFFADSGLTSNLFSLKLG